MKRNPIDQFLADPDNKAKLFRWMTYGMIITTFLITVGFLFFIIHLVGIILFLDLQFESYFLLFHLIF